MKHGLKRFTRYVLVAALSVSLAVPTMAATKAEVQSQIEDLKNQQSELESQLAELKQNKSDTESYISELDDKIKTYLAQLEEVSAQLEQTESEISITQDNLAQAKEDEKTQYTALKARIKAMYESGDDDYLQMLLGSGDLKTMLNNQEYISKINEYDHNLLVNLQNIRDQIAAYEAQLEEQKQLQEAQKEQYEVEKESLEKIVAQKEEELVAIGSGKGPAPLHGDLHRLLGDKLGLGGHHRPAGAALGQFVPGPLPAVFVGDVGQDHGLHKPLDKGGLPRPGGPHHADVDVPRRALGDVLGTARYYDAPFRRKSTDVFPVIDYWAQPPNP